MSIDIKGFIEEAHLTLPEWRHPSPMAGVDKQRRTIKDIKGRVRNMPPDDGFDEAFFLFLENTSQDIEGVIYKTRVNPWLFYMEIRKAGYNPNFAIYRLFSGNKPKKVFMDAIDAHYKGSL